MAQKLSLNLFLTCVLFEYLTLAKLDVNLVQKKQLEDSFKELLDLPRLPENASALLPATGASAAAYMQRLFRKYSHTHFGPNEGNVVRSITPKIDKLGGHKVLSFHLKGIRSKERILAAEIHYNHRSKKRKHLSKRSRNVRCFAVSKTGSITPLLRKVTSDQWVSFDVSSVLRRQLRHVKSSRDNSDSNADVIGVVFAHEKRGGLKFHHPRKTIKYSSPFMIVHSDDTTSSDAVGWDDPNSLLDVKRPSKSRPKRQAVASESNYYSYSVGDAKNDGPQVAVEDFVRHGPSVLQTRKEWRRQRHRDRYAVLPDPFGKKKSKSMAIDDREMAADWDFSSPYQTGEYGVIPNSGVVLLKSDRPQEPCKKYELVVDFRDIGWHDWIIAPKSFEAHYCQGSCSYRPGSSNPRQTNHAIIQNIIHNIGLNPNVAPPCCAPEKMDSLTLLYYDEGGNVVLKNYPKMTVKSCACL